MAGMKVLDRLIQHFGGKLETCIALDNIHPETLRLWEKNGIPLSKALWLEEKTGGAIKAEQVLKEAREAA